jgi:hypothetical protein
MARFTFLLLASAISLTTTASASSHKRDIVKPLQKGRFAPSNNASISQAYDNNLLARYYDCLPGAHLCPAGQCCDFTCCLDGSCCPAAQLCYNDVKPSKGPTYCCEVYTEKQCDTRCVPMESECCGDGFYVRFLVVPGCLWISANCCSASMATRVVGGFV